MLVSRSFRRGEVANRGTDVKKLLDVCRRASFASDLVWSFFVWSLRQSLHEIQASDTS